MIHLADMPGAFTFGETLEIVYDKILNEAQTYSIWADDTIEPLLEINTK